MIVVSCQLSVVRGFGLRAGGWRPVMRVTRGEASWRKCRRGKNLTLRGGVLNIEIA